MASNISVKQNQSCPRNIVKTVAGRDIINLLCLKKQHQYERDWDNEIIKKRKLGKVVKRNHMALNWKMRLQKHKESASIVSQYYVQNFVNYWLRRKQLKWFFAKNVETKTWKEAIEFKINSIVLKLALKLIISFQIKSAVMHLLAWLHLRKSKAVRKVWVSQEKVGSFTSLYHGETKFKIDGEFVEIL